MKYVVTNTVLFHAGKKYKRGDIVDMEKNEHGKSVEPYIEPVAPVKKTRAKRKPKAES
jgi:hypothetical protein